MALTPAFSIEKMSVRLLISVYPKERIGNEFDRDARTECPECSLLASTSGVREYER